MLPGKQETLEAAVAAEVAAGVRDPTEILARLSERHGQAWLLRQLVNVVARLVAGGAGIRAAPAVRPAAVGRRAVVGERKPSVRTRTRVEKALGEEAGGFFAQSRWVSAEVGWKPLLELTADDCRAIAKQLDAIADVAGRHRRWFEDAAAVIEREGVTTLGDVNRRLVAPAGALPAGGTTL